MGALSNSVTRRRLVGFTYGSAVMKHCHPHIKHESESQGTATGARTGRWRPSTRAAADHRNGTLIGVG